MAPRSQQDGPKQLLSLDGGGVRGISSVLILDRIMKEIRKNEIDSGVNLSVEERLPVDYFHLAAGTSTGGLIAVMLFRLKMNVPQTIEAYRSLADNVFTPRLFGIPLQKFKVFGYNIGNPILWLKAVFTKAQFSDGPLKQAIDEIVGKHGMDSVDESQKGRALLVHKHASKLIMCATLADKGESILFRSYSAPPDAEPISSQATLHQMEEISISTACRAISAGPTYLPEVIWNGMKFWDGGLLNNNPIHQLWAARYDLAEPQTDPDALANPAPPIGCIVSLGTSWSSKTPKSPFRFINTVAGVVPFLANTEAKNRDFHRELNRVNARLPQGEKTAYFRFNAPTGDEIFMLDEYEGMGRLEELTEQYLQDSKVVEDIASCVQKLRSIQS